MFSRLSSPVSSRPVSSIGSSRPASSIAATPKTQTQLKKVSRYNIFI